MMMLIPQEHDRINWQLSVCSKVERLNSLRNKVCAQSMHVICQTQVPLHASSPEESDQFEICNLERKVKGMKFIVETGHWGLVQVQVIIEERCR